MSKLKFHFAGFFMSGLWLSFWILNLLGFLSVCVCILSFVIFWHCLLYSSPVLGLHSFCFVLFFCFFFLCFFLSMKFLHMDTR